MTFGGNSHRKARPGYRLQVASGRIAMLASIFVLCSSLISGAESLTGNQQSESNAKQVSSRAQIEPAPQQRLLVSVVDDNGVAVQSARVTFTHLESHSSVKGETDFAGRLELSGLSAGLYRVQVEKEGFYVAKFDDVRVGEALTLEIVLNHVQEFAESVDVTYSAPAIDVSKTNASESLDSQEILNIPYPSTRDIKNLLPFIPGVVQDSTGEIHLNGSASSQIYNQLDGFNLASPVSGLSAFRVSADALRSIEVMGSRYSAEYGKGSGGVIALNTGMGDDRYRFSATNFVPSVQTRKGLSLDSWTPRATFSGPLKRKRAWFYEAADAEYNLDIINEQPEGADRNQSWRVSNLAKAQVNLNQSNILTAGFLINRFHADHLGISRFNPVETTRDLTRNAYLITIKEQSYFSNGSLLEVGFAASRFRIDERPVAGNLPFVISPEGASGNYFKTSEERAGRSQLIANLFLPPVNRVGRHEFKFGLDANRTVYDKRTERREITILRGDRTTSRRILFDGFSNLKKNNFEASLYAQDRWSINGRSLAELGLRVDWDGIIRGAFLSPRLAISHLLARDGGTKIAGGVGLFYDAANLDLITRPLDGRRTDLLFSEDGLTLRRPPLETQFRADESRLKATQFINWSVGVDQKLPNSIYLRVEVTGKRGRDGLAFFGADGLADPDALFELRNARRDRYDSLQITARRAFGRGYEMFASYTRSSARSNAVFDFNIDNPIFGSQAEGPLPWDTPNRFISWGWFPLVRRFDLAYSLEWRDGFPFSVVNQDQQLVGQPNSRRLPTVFSLNVHVERRFQVIGLKLALRAGFNNVTGHDNPTGVNNNIDSPGFLTFGGVQDRAFTGRI
ncbi:MAG TPA: TonB-dependent receptor, partial [Blastocatellia bacterium]|nr:TonB-dependent receptor [Blastocatellia bacterium]